MINTREFAFSALLCLQCFDAIGCAAGRASGLQKYGEDGGGEHWLVQMEWRPAG